MRNTESEFGLAQRQVASWQRSVFPPDLNTPRQHFGRSMDDMRDLSEAISADDGTAAARKEIGSEATDVILQMLGIAAIVRVNVAATLPDRVSELTNRHRPDVIRGDLDRGVPFSLAMAKERRVRRG